MSRWYMVSFHNKYGKHYEIASSGNTRRSAERTSRSKLRGKIGDKEKGFYTTWIAPCAPPAGYR